MLLAVCAATAAVKEGVDPDDASRLVESLAAHHSVPDRREIHVLLRHAADPVEEARLALAREPRPASRRYADYQRNLALVLYAQAEQGMYDEVVTRGDRPILEIQRELRRHLHTCGVPTTVLPPDAPDRLWVLGGLSESGKSTVGELLRTEHGAVRLKIGYLLDLAAVRAGVTDPYEAWDEPAQAEALSEEVARLCHMNKGTRRVSVESAHRYEATLHLKRIWGDRCQVIYVDADTVSRTARSQEPAASLSDRDKVKIERGAERIAQVADWVIDNTRSLAALLASTPIPDEELTDNLALYLGRRSLMDVLALDALYRKILSVPGVVMEFGAGWGTPPRCPGRATGHPRAL
ncbi:MAG: hypothetical protein ACRDN9_01775 [Streptosporangiaceae bacterium]